MTCPACEARKTNPTHAIYYVQCRGCKATQSAIAYPLHLSRLKAIKASKDRKAYIDGVRRIESDEAADMLGQAYAKWWEAQRAK